LRQTSQPVGRKLSRAFGSFFDRVFSGAEVIV
jgi:hypothetical protein